MQPLHLIAYPAARFTMCGRRTATKEALPWLYLPFLPMHEAGRGPLTLCPDCESEIE